jgi:Na+/H+ antiporter NhaD/arsenite permease-like protein
MSEVLQAEVSGAPSRAESVWLPWVAGLLTLLAIGLLALVHIQVSEKDSLALHHELPRWSVLPFAALLGAIAIAPLAAPRAWDSHAVKAAVVAGLSAPLALYLVAGFGSAGAHELFEKSREYVSFLCLLGALFVIAGGVLVEGSLSGTPLMNAAMLGIGALLASLIGTTGASMVLIRPFLRANRTREDRSHLVVFFIFVVSNCGGLLTPLGDPPLFLGFLKGVPFQWAAQRLWAPWLFVNGVLIALFHVYDQVVFQREEARRPGSQLEEVLRHEPLRVRGAFNLLFLFGVVAVIFLSGSGGLNGGRSWPFGVQEAAMLALAAASYLSTPRAVHESNAFSFAPLAEVALLFAGIFTTMIPALLLLNAHASAIGLSRPWHFFWGSGLLSSVLDNAPTYLAFASAAAGIHGIAPDGRYLEALVQRGSGDALLMAVAAGSVLMGANTYIGNGPNFMVKAIAERDGVSMPSFHGYVGYSAAVLLPIFLAVTLLFFR